MNQFLTHKPNFFIIGMPRSGTTSLYLYLKQHPQVYLSILKEPHFFGSNLPNLYSYVRDINEYSSLFQGVKNEKIIGEGSVWYLESQSAIDEIYRFNSISKLVVTLRNPVDMILSLHSLYLRTGNEDVLDFVEAFKLQDKRNNNKFLPKDCYYKHGLQYGKIGLYNEKIMKLYSLFKREQIHIILFDDLVNHPDKTYQNLLEFLDLDSFSPIFDKSEAERAIQNKVLNQLKTTSVNVKKKLRQKRINLHEKTSNYSLNNKTRNELLNFYKEDIIATSNLTNIDMTSWIDS